MKIANDVGAVLSTLVVDGEVARIAEKLDRRLYLRVNEVLEALGGRWSRRLNGHVFDADPTLSLGDRISDAIEAGEVDHPKDMDFFPTPKLVADDLVRRAWLRPRSRVLEPSAGEGHLALAACETGAEVTCVEANPRRARLLRKLPAPRVVRVVEADFLGWAPEHRGEFDAAVMNPPFSRRQDLAHALAALECLRPGGRLVAVASAGVAFRMDRRSVEFRALVHRSGGRIDPLPEGAFRESGTMVRAVVVEATRAEGGAS